MAKLITVSQINRYIARLLENNQHLQSFEIRGEISGGKVYQSGHYYFTLKDETAQVSCVMFRSAFQQVSFKPQNGDKVVLTAKASFYERDGRFQLYAFKMAKDGIGELYLAFEALKKKLEAEGLFAEERKQKIPFLPRKIAVVTSESGAVIRDIIQVLRRRFPGFSLELYPTLVQGDKAAEQIAAAIQQINRTSDASVIIVGRGGGSMEDLNCFNEEQVARAIAASKIPLISAVGHETDFTIADFVADLRAPTPSAAAELVVPVKAELFAAIQTLEFRLWSSLERKFELNEKHFKSLNQRLTGDKLQYLATREAQHLDFSRERLERALEKVTLMLKTKLQTTGQNLAFFNPQKQLLLVRSQQQQVLKNFMRSLENIGENQRTHLSEQCLKMDALNPFKVLARGYSVVTNAQGQVIREMRSLKEKEQLKLRFLDGQAVCTVNTLEEEQL